MGVRQQAVNQTLGIGALVTGAINKQVIDKTTPALNTAKEMIKKDTLKADIAKDVAEDNLLQQGEKLNKLQKKLENSPSPMASDDPNYIQRESKRMHNLSTRLTNAQARQNAAEKLLDEAKSKYETLKAKKERFIKLSEKRGFIGKNKAYKEGMDYVMENF